MTGTVYIASDDGWIPIGTTEGVRFGPNPDHVKESTLPELPTRNDVLVLAWEKYNSSNFSGNAKLMEEAKFLVSFAALLPTEPSDITDEFINADMEDDRP